MDVKIRRTTALRSTKKKASVTPRGRSAVKKAILDAAEKLLVDKSPSKITVREIAREAKVQHPLIHRHFGTKEELIMAVHARSISKMDAVISKIESLDGNIPDFFRTIKKNKSRQLALARTMIDGVNPHSIQHDFPVMQHFIALLKKRREESGKEFDVELMSAVLGATTLGWIVFEPFLFASTGLDKRDKDDIDRGVIEVLTKIIDTLC